MWGLSIIALFVLLFWIAAKIEARFVQRQSRFGRVLLIMLGLLALLHIDAVPGYFVYRHWVRKTDHPHTTGSIPVEGFLRPSTLLWNLPQPYAYIETDNLFLPRSLLNDRFVHYWLAPEGDARCSGLPAVPLNPAARKAAIPVGRCIAQAFSAEPISRYELSITSSSALNGRSNPFPILGQRYQVVDRATDRVIAECTEVIFRPRIAPWFQLFEFAHLPPCSRKAPEFWVQDVLTPVSVSRATYKGL